MQIDAREKRRKKEKRTSHGWGYIEVATLYCRFLNSLGNINLNSTSIYSTIIIILGISLSIHVIFYIHPIFLQSIIFFFGLAKFCSPTHNLCSENPLLLYSLIPLPSKRPQSPIPLTQIRRIVTCHLLAILSHTFATRVYILIHIPSQTLEPIFLRLQQHIKLPLTLPLDPIHIPTQIRLRISRTQHGDLCL